MRVFIALLICVFLCACSTRPQHAYSPAGQGSDAMCADNATGSDNATTLEGTCGDHDDIAKMTGKKKGATVGEVVKAVAIGVVTLVAIGLYILIRIPAGAR